MGCNSQEDLLLLSDLAAPPRARSAVRIAAVEADWSPELSISSPAGQGPSSEPALPTCPGLSRSACPPPPATPEPGTPGGRQSLALGLCCHPGVLPSCPGRQGDPSQASCRVAGSPSLPQVDRWLQASAAECLPDAAPRQTSAHSHCVPAAWVVWSGMESRGQRSRVPIATNFLKVPSGAG